MAQWPPLRTLVKTTCNCYSRDHTIHLLIYRTFSSLFTKEFCIIAVVLQRLLISKAPLMLLIR